MKRIDHSLRVAAPLLAAALAFVVSNAHATPAVNAAHVTTRVFNDCPVSIVTYTNAYPGLIQIADELNPLCAGYANLHVWSFSSDGGATDTQFSNGDAFAFSATLVLNGTSDGEAGLRLSPWWAELTDGRFNCKTVGEIACFGGRLPFYSFTANYGVNYTKGAQARLEIIYLPNGLSVSSPGTIQYNLNIYSTSYTSGVLPFDEGNTAEDPPHGLWGILTPAEAGGHLQELLGTAPAGVTPTLQATWNDILFQDLTPVPTQKTTWGKIKAIYR